MKENKSAVQPDFTDKRIFRQVLSSDISLCRELINRIAPDIDTEDLRYVATEDAVIVSAGGRNIIILDICTEND
ncbi:MAG: hypothetical protein IJM63_11995 [Solobacterium sp.]|nr:hypothetical protein [Solobacterium sp.]